MNYTNQLIHETSPYLLQHAHNPVNWYAWKTTALSKAKQEDKPILLSIGYSTCHWCHVMERESFENEEIAAFMNEHFVNIKVDREERPDLDQIYMEACQTINGQGGWPLNCFLLPDGRPFYAGTYFPPHSQRNRPSWMQVLQGILKAFKEQRETVEKQADRLMDFIQKSDNTFIKKDLLGLHKESIFTKALSDSIFESLKSKFDQKEGGFGGAPKFPSVMSLRYLLNYYFFTKNKEALKQVELSLDKMIMGGIYDQLGGGFARYATDKAWLIPHFEKMLYDNALLINLLVDVYKINGKELYKETIRETLDFIEREMTSEEGAFYSALDADSEGVEGKFYVWDKEEIDDALGKDAPLFCEFYQVTQQGNWEGKNILWRPQTFEQFTQSKGLEVIAFKTKMAQDRSRLFQTRVERIRPGLDDKILLSWNALQIIAYTNAYKALKTPTYKEAALRAVHFIFEKMVQKDGFTLYHTYKNGKAQYRAFLEDYAFLIDALVHVYEITGNTRWLDLADQYIAFAVERFWDKTANLFFYTDENQTDIIVRKKDVYDSATPSANATMAINLHKIGILVGKEAYKEKALSMLLSMKDSVEKYPTSFSRWASAMLNLVYSIEEIAIVGKAAWQEVEKLHARYIPNKVFMATDTKNEDFPLLAGKPAKDDLLVYICRNYLCGQPLESIDAYLDKQEK